MASDTVRTASRSGSPSPSAGSARVSAGAKRSRGQAAAGRAVQSKRRKGSAPDETTGNDDHEGAGSEIEGRSDADGDIASAGGDLSDASGSAAHAGARASKRSKTKRPELNADGEEIFCVCRDVWDGEEFMIACDECGEWYHGRCVGISPARGKKMSKYECDACIEKFKERERFARSRDKKAGKESDHPEDSGDDEYVDGKLQTDAASPGAKPQVAAKVHGIAPKSGAMKASGSAVKPLAVRPLSKAKVSDGPAAATPATPTSASIATPIDPWNGDVPDKTDNNVRQSARKAFESIFAEFFPEASADAAASAHAVLKPAAFAATLETHMYIALRDHSFQPGEKYKAQYRSLRLNLKDASNVTLRSRILSGELLPETLATLTSEQMASEEAMKLAEEIRQQSLKEVVLKAESERTIFRKTHKGEEEVVTTCAEPVASAPAAGRKADKSVTPSGRGDPTGDFERELPRRASIATGAVPTSDRQAQHSLDDLLAQMDDRRGSFSGTPEEGTPEDVGTRRLDSPPLEAQDDGSRSPFADQALDTGPPADPVIWKGTLQMPSVASFKCQARQIAGRRLMDAADGHDHVLANLQWDDVLRDPLQIDGRVGPDKVIDYLVQQTYSTTKEVVVIQFETEDGDGAGAFTEGDKSEYKILFEYFQTRSRYGVFGPGSRKPVAKDMYLVPVRAEDSLPDFMEFVSGSSVKDGVARKRDLLFGVAVLLKQKPATTPPSRDLDISQSGEVGVADHGADHQRSGYRESDTAAANEALLSAGAALGTWDAFPAGTAALDPAPLEPVPNPSPAYVPATVPPPSFGLKPTVGDPLTALTSVNLSSLLNQIQTLNSGQPGIPQAQLPIASQGWQQQNALPTPSDPRLARQQPASAVMAPYANVYPPAPVSQQPGQVPSMGAWQQPGIPTGQPTYYAGANAQGTAYPGTQGQPAYGGGSPGRSGGNSRGRGSYRGQDNRWRGR